MSTIPQVSAERQGEPQFSMQGAREVIQIMGTAVHIQRQVTALESAVNDNPGLAFDLAKTLVETVCKTILADRGKEVDDKLDAPQLFRETIRYLQIIPDEHPRPEARESVQKTLGALQGIVAGLCELRNKEGFASHGKDAYTKFLESMQAQLAARSADAIVNFLFKAHRSYRAGSAPVRLHYEDHAAFNDFLDDVNIPVIISDYEFLPSETLFEMDEEAYKDLLTQFLARTLDSETAGADAAEPPYAAGAAAGEKGGSA